MVNADNPVPPTRLLIRSIWLILSAVVAIAPLAIGQPQASGPPQAAAAQGALVKQYCVGCHNNKLKTASLSLEGLDLSKVSGDADTWEKVLRKVNANQMPPMGLPHPSDDAKKAFTGYLETELDRAAVAHPNPGRPTIHRINRSEYSNAIRDLLALDIKPGASLPPDDSGYGFDNIGDVLSLSPVLIERYMSVSRNVARLAVGDTNVKPVIDVFAPVKEVRAASKGGPRVPRNERISDDLPFDSAGGLSFQYTFPVDAEYDFKVKLPAPAAGFGETAAPVGQLLELRIPVKAGVHQVGLTFMRSGAVPEILPVLGAVRGGGGGAGRGAAPPTPQVAHLDLRLDGARLKLYDIPETGNNATFNELAIGGPYNIVGAGDSPSRQKIFVCKPASAKDDDPCARKILSNLGRHAYRRPFTDTDLKPLMTFYASARAEGGSFDNGIEMALRAMLVSPDFLFRVERDPAGAAPGSVRRINSYEMASRLSFFLWSSIPDDELLKLADENKLQNEKVIEQQVARMLDDPKSKAFTSNFAGQYLYLRNLTMMKPDPDEYPEYDASLRRSFETETQMFFNSVVRENRPVTELLDAKYTFVNQHLAEFYGIPNVYGPQFRRVELTDPNRGGVLGQGSLLTVTSYPNRTSVVQRGKWVLENLLGTPPPPPPPNIPSLDPHGKDGKMSMRQAMEMHRANAVCASCHSRMDPIGFALENFDGVGQWRDKDSGSGTPIDASGKLPDGTTFSGAAGLKQLLISQHREEFISTFTEKLMTYALGRGLESYDHPAVRAIMRDAAKQNDTIPALIQSIVKSPQFQMRKTKES
jgi:mono/diheme cytochrome c family protein